jgi:hypothetical protein
MKLGNIFPLIPKRVYGPRCFFSKVEVSVSRRVVRWPYRKIPESHINDTGQHICNYDGRGVPVMHSYSGNFLQKIMTRR